MRREQREQRSRGGAQTRDGGLTRSLLAMIMHHGMHANSVAASGEEAMLQAMILHSARRAAGREACYSGEKLIHSALSVIKNEMLQRSGGGRDQMATRSRSIEPPKQLFPENFSGKKLRGS